MGAKVHICRKGAMHTKNNKKRAWYLHSVGGLVLTGAGISVVGEGILLKAQDAALWQWFAVGTLGLILFNSGLAVVAKAAVLLAELRRER